MEHHIFLGHYSSGYYISVLDMFIATDLSTPDDLSFNQEKLLEAGMPDFWAMTFAQDFWVFDLTLHEDLEAGCKRAEEGQSD